MVPPFPPPDKRPPRPGRLRRFFGGVRSGLGQMVWDLKRLMLLPFSGGQIRSGFSQFFRDMRRLIGLPLESLKPEEMIKTVARDKRDLIASGQAVVETATGAIGGAGRTLWRSPWMFFRWLFHAPFRAWFYLRTRPPLQLAILTCLALLFVTGIAMPAFHIVKERNIEKLRQEQYRQLDEHFLRNNVDGVRHNLQVLINATPGDDALKARQATLDSGVAAAGDYRMARLLMRQHLSQNRIADCCREARKYVEFAPRDWEALVILASQALATGDDAAAATFVARLPRPHEPSEPVSAWSCAMAGKLFADIGDRDRLNDLIGFVAERFVPVLRSEAMPRISPGVRLQFLELYNLALSQLDRIPALAKFWATAQTLAHGIVESSDANAAVLAGLGRLQDVQLDRYLRDLVRLGHLRAEDYKQHYDEIEGRLAKIWSRLRELDPKQPMAYIGPAVQRARAGRLDEAVGVVDEGISKLGPAQELVEWKARFLCKSDPMSGLRFLGTVLNPDKQTASMYRIVAETSMAAGRPDVALAAIKEANAVVPGQAWTNRVEADVMMQAGRPTEAAAALRRNPAALATDPAAAQIYVRALADSGAIVLAEEFLAQACDQERSRPAVVAGVEALVRMNHNGPASAVLRKLLRTDPSNISGHVLLAECLRRQAEEAPGPGWDAALVDEALKAYRAAALRFPDDPNIARQIAWLLLVARNSPREAFEAAGPMRAAEAPPAAVLDVLGAVYVAAGEPAKGRDALEAFVRQRSKRAGVLAWLALAYHGLNQTTLANETIAQAMKLPKAHPREGEMVLWAQERIARGAK